MAEPFAGLPKYHFRTIVADPPWSFRTWSKTNQTRAAENHYAVMSLDDVMELPVCDLAADDCVLLLWATNPMLPQALQVIDAWGFVYKTVGFMWAKRTMRDLTSWHMGLGYWTRQNTESCLLATRGHPVRFAKNVRQLVVAPRCRHSQKPDIYNDIERLLAGPYCELFAREAVPRFGWTFWGDDA